MSGISGISRENPAKCIGCGCTDNRACAGGCSWLAVDRKVGLGVCSNCPGYLSEWPSARAGNTRVVDQTATAKLREARKYLGKVRSPTAEELRADRLKLERRRIKAKAAKRAKQAARRRP